MQDNFQCDRTNLDISTSWSKLEHTGWMEEAGSWAKTCIIVDWSFLKEFYVKGPDALKLFKDFAINSFLKFDVGQAKHLIFCSKEGKVIGEGILIRKGKEKFEFQSCGLVILWLEYNLIKGGYKATADTKIGKFKYQISGPNNLLLLEKVTKANLCDLKCMRYGKFKINRKLINILRLERNDQIDFIVQGSNKYSSEMLAVIFEYGKQYGLTRISSRTVMVNYVEACMPAFIYDYLPAIGGGAEKDFIYNLNTVEADGHKSDLFRSLNKYLKIKGSFEDNSIIAWYRSPVELGWTKYIEFDHDFYGRKALEDEVANPKRTIVTLEWNAEDCLDVYASLFRNNEESYDFMDMPRQMWFCMYANKVLNGDQLIGIATSRGFSIKYRKMLSLCVIDVKFQKPGTKVSVVWGDPTSRQKIIRATVANSTFKREAERRIDYVEFS